MVDGKGTAVHVTERGWSLVTEHNVMFNRSQHQAPLPTPVRGGDLRRLLDFVNVRDTGQQLLLLCSTIVALIPDIAQPLLLLMGPQGSAKSTAAFFRRQLIDPSSTPLLVTKQHVDALAQTCEQHYNPVFDNLGAINPEQSNFFCQVVTGGAFEKRELYTNDGTVVMKLFRGITFTAINPPSDAPDLLERSLLIELDPITPSARRSQRELESEFEAARPEIFGGILDALVKVLAVAPGLQLTTHHRMADFSRNGAAAAMALGSTMDAFEAAFERNSRTQRGAALEHPVSLAVMCLMRHTPTWSGTSTALLVDLQAQTPPDTVKRDRKWPTNASLLSKRMRELAPFLGDAGIDVTFRAGHNDARLITLTKRGVPTPDEPTPAPGMPAPPFDDASPNVSHRNAKLEEETSQDGEDTKDAAALRIVNVAGRRRPLSTSPSES